jgi:hypothetical protein
MSEGTLEDKIRHYATNEKQLAGIKANLSHRYIDVPEANNPTFTTGLIYDYTQTKPEIKLLPGSIEGTYQQCKTQAQNLYSKIKSNERLSIEKDTIKSTSGYMLNFIDNKITCGESDNCNISNFNSSTNNKQVLINGPDSCVIRDHDNMEIFCYFKPNRSGKWRISSGNMRGAAKFKMWLLKDKAVYDYLYYNADLKSPDDSKTIHLNKNYYYSLRIHVSGVFSAGDRSDLMQFSILDLFTYADTAGGNVVKPENMFRLLSNPDGSLYKPHLVYYGLVRVPNRKGIYKCYFVDPNVVNNFSTIEKLKFNCPDFLIKRDKVNIVLGKLNTNVRTQPGASLTTANELVYTPAYGDIVDVQSSASIVPAVRREQHGMTTDNGAFGNAMNSYNNDMNNWRREVAAEIAALAAAKVRANADAMAKLAAANASNVRAEAAKVRAEAAAKARAIASRARTRFLSFWQRLAAMFAARRRAHAAARSRAARAAAQRALNKAQAEQASAKVALDRAANEERIKQVAHNAAIASADASTAAAQQALKVAVDAQKAAAEAATREQARVLALSIETAAKENALKATKDAATVVATAAASKARSVATVVSEQAKNGIDATANIAKGVGNIATTATANRNNSAPKNITKTLSNVFSGSRLGYENIEGFTEGYRPEPQRPTTNNYQMPNMVNTPYNRVVGDTRNIVSWDKNSLSISNAQYNELESNRFTKSPNYNPNHPGARAIDITATVAVDGKMEARIYIDNGRPMFSYYEGGQTKVAPLHSSINNAVSFKIWDEAKPGPNGVNFGDIYVVCNGPDLSNGSIVGPWISGGNTPILKIETDPDGNKLYVGFQAPYTKMVNSKGVARYYTGPLDNYSSYFWKNGIDAGRNYIYQPATNADLGRIFVKLTCFAFKAPRPNEVEPNQFWLAADAARCSSSYAIPNQTTALITGDMTMSELVSPKGIFMLSFQKNEDDQQFYLYMKYGKNVRGGNNYSATDTYSRTSSGQPILYLRRPLTAGFSNDVYQFTTYKDTGATEARAIPRIFKNMLGTAGFSETQNKNYYPHDLALDSVDIKYKTVTPVKGVDECRKQCLEDNKCHNFYYEQRSKGGNRCMLDQAGAKTSVSTFAKTSPDIQMSVYGTKKLQTLANPYDRDVYSQFNERALQPSGLGINTTVIFNDKMIIDDTRYLGNAVIREFNQLKNDTNASFNIETNPHADLPSTAAREGFDTGPSDYRQELIDLNAKEQEIHGVQGEYSDAYSATNLALNTYHGQQKDIYGTKDYTGTDIERDEKGALFRYKTNDTDYVIPAKFAKTIPYNYEKPVSSVEDARQEDLNELLLQQNSMYTIGTLTAATFLITAIVLARE